MTFPDRQDHRLRSGGWIADAGSVELLHQLSRATRHDPILWVFVARQAPPMLDPNLLAIPEGTQLHDETDLSGSSRTWTRGSFH